MVLSMIPPVAAIRGTLTVITALVAVAIASPRAALAAVASDDAPALPVDVTERGPTRADLGAFSFATYGGLDRELATALGGDAASPEGSALEGFGAWYRLPEQSNWGVGLDVARTGPRADARVDRRPSVVTVNGIHRWSAPDLADGLGLESFEPHVGAGLGVLSPHSDDATIGFDDGAFAGVAPAARLFGGLRATVRGPLSVFAEARLTWTDGDALPGAGGSDVEDWSGQVVFGLSLRF